MIDRTLGIGAVGADHPGLPPAGASFPELGIDVRYDSQDTVVVLTGELDVATAPFLGSRLDILRQTSRRRLVVDVSALRFCDCSGLGALVRAHRRATETGGWVRLCGATGNIEMIIRITQVPSILGCYADAAAALAGL
jgi:anti-sigma B factor antagonist